MGTNQSLSDRAFQTNLAFGQQAETAIAKLLMARGWLVCPAYDIEYETGKGPRLYGAVRNYVLPDLVVFRANEVRFVEAKHKRVFTWYRKHRCWVTGIDLHHYHDYSAIADKLSHSLWLMFLHIDDRPDDRDLRYADCPRTCPTGLFCSDIKALQKTEDHRALPRSGDNGWGRHGMVYWAQEAFTRVPLDRLSGIAHSSTTTTGNP